MFQNINLKNKKQTLKGYRSMKKINHEQFEKLIKLYYKQKSNDGRKIPLLAYGTFGVGKSAVVRQTAIELAESKGKEFIDWNCISKEEKDNIAENPSKYFLLIDIRLSEFDSSDIKGLPDFKDDNSIVWKIPFWARVLTHPESDGLLFFDEINLATPLVISSTYKILYDRIVNESKINDNWLIMGCGNKDDDKAHTHELAAPVRDRGGEVELTHPSSEAWIDWAVDNNIDSRIIGFLSWKPSNLHSVDFDDNQKYTTERGWERLDTLLKGVKDYKTMELVSGTAIGEGVAREYVAFCKIKDSISLDEVLKNPEKLKSVEEISVKYFLTTAIGENYKTNKVKFEQVMKISEVFDDMNNVEFVALLWRLCIRYSPTKFKKDFTSKDLDNPIR